MSVFFRFRYIQLSVILADCPGQTQRYVGTRKSGENSGQIRSKVGHGHKTDVFGATLPAESAGIFFRKIRLDEGLGNLARAVAAGIEKKYRVIILDCGAPLTVLAHDRRQQVFVSFAPVVRLRQRLFGARRPAFSLTVYHGGIRPPGALPGLIAVHGVESSHNGGDTLAVFHLFAQLAQMPDGRMRRRIAPVGKQMQIDFFYFLTTQIFQKGV